LGSCAPYTYFSDFFFQKKISATDPKGTKNLDLITFADESFFGHHYEDRLTNALMSYAEKNIKQTFQVIIGTDTKYHFGINGDEDNPTSP
jgi:hypothetical protein